MSLFQSTATENALSTLLQFPRALVKLELHLTAAFSIVPFEDSYISLESKLWSDRRTDMAALTRAMSDQASTLQTLTLKPPMPESKLLDGYGIHGSRYQLRTFTSLKHLTIPIFMLLGNDDVFGDARRSSRDRRCTDL